ncbi:hypothetical protein [Turneriella parva]|uniref:Prevent-host-death family protein n=1 Tax=Turneriella parva (strain ATCC BAA-1111 / DSM 21527 / NCTC 11395 / H) TaxID=869212 RepID=I4B262_TURPD|nr:hypothetical protein [Turneriella parva]AFM11369.1 hypothetical protein Turpa_0718 [Turneriella parva DSM 21527]
MKKKIKVANTQAMPKVSDSMKPYSVIKNKNSKPVFVLVPYEVWQESKQKLGSRSTRKISTGEPPKRSVKSNPWVDFAGSLEVREDGLEFQKRLRSEWS